MRLSVDASALVAEALRVRGRALLRDPLLDLVTANDAWQETEHELPRRVDAIAGRRSISPEEARELLEDALHTILLYVAIAPSPLYAPRLDEARERLPRDAGDAPTLALALTLDCGIWTADRDFFGCGMPVWSTDVLLWYVRRQTRAEPSAG